MAAPGSSFLPVGRSPRLTDTIADRLLEAIVDGRLAPGALLPSERELGAQFGVSRTVIREAIRALTTRGVVEVLSGRGVRVIQLDTASVTDAMSLLLRGESSIDFPKVHEVRLMLETHIAGLVAERSSPADHDALDALIVAWQQAGSDIFAAARVDFDFHRTLAACTGNELFVLLIDALSGALMEERRRTLLVPKHSLAKVYGEHRAIVEAIKARDPDDARAAMAAHLAGAAAVWRERQERTVVG
jgi:GntR family transcriptional repressor for pyruvate dehydrogenase complex